MVDIIFKTSLRTFESPDVIVIENNEGDLSPLKELIGKTVIDIGEGCELSNRQVGDDLRMYIFSRPKVSTKNGVCITYVGNVKPNVAVVFNGNFFRLPSFINYNNAAELLENFGDRIVHKRSSWVADEYLVEDTFSNEVFYIILTK
jgi:hypothetical protein